jgi:hypothetical protein
MITRVVDPHQLDADPDAVPHSTYQPDADPNADPDQTFHLDTDPNPDPGCQIRTQTLEKVLK